MIEYNSMFVEIRLTHSLLDISYERAVALLKRFVEKQKFEVQSYLYGVECQNKFGEPTSAHIHFKFETDVDVKKNTLQKNFREFMKHNGEPVSGVRHYAIMLETQPEDEDRWWRYVLKEEGGKFGWSSDKHAFVEENIALARDERKQQIKRNIEARERYLETDSFKGKMFKHFTEELTITTEREFYVELIKYFQAKSKVPPFSKIKDYWRDYQISVGLITAEYFVDAFIMENKKI